VVACVSPDTAALGRGPRDLGPGPCAAAVQPVIKRVVAVAGDVVDLSPDAVVVNGRALPGSSSAEVDSVGRRLPHVRWGRHVVAPGELWVVSARVPNSWDSRYLAPVSLSQVRAVA
jgi:conjugative transfer signal peptidase TraF